MTKQLEHTSRGDTSQSDRIARIPGIAFEHVEISFVYSFVCEVPNFNEVAKYVLSTPFRESTRADSGSVQHEVLRPDEAVRAFRRKNKLNANVCYWSVGVHPERLGISPVIRFGSAASGKAAQKQSDSGIYCWIRNSGPFEIRSDYFDSEFKTALIPKTSLALEVRDYEVLFRLGSSGAGSVTFKFELERKNFPAIFPKDARARLAVLHDHLGMLPFIFTVLTLGRTETDGSRNGAPSSRIRNSRERKIQFRTLKELFCEFLFGTALPRLNSTTRPSKDDASLPVVSLDREVAGTASDKIPNLWQAPYVCVVADLDKDSTVIEQADADAHAWWYQHYSRRLYRPHWTPPHSKAGAVNVWKCYKETILLLLRLYQWRDILEIDGCLECLARGGKREDLPLPHWRRVLVLPDLLRKTHFGKLFGDVDMVWDTRYLLLYHERSTLVLNYVGLPSEEEPDKNDDKSKLAFRVLFAQSLLNTLEQIRSQWHAAVVLNAVLDNLVSLFQSPDSAVNPRAFRDIAAKRQVYARALRDPLIPGVESASLSVVRRRAHRDFEIPFLFQNLRDKFLAIDRFIVDQAAVRNLDYVAKRGRGADQKL